MRGILFSIFFLFVFYASAQSDQPPFTPADLRIDGFDKRQALIEKSIVKNVKFKNIGPTVFSGRVTDIDVNPEDPSHFYVAYASGGLWKTENNGTTFKPVFDNQIVMTIGDIAVDWRNDVIWLGSGENNSSRSSYSGVGIFKSIDSGKNWEHLGLPESHHIGRIILHPQNPEVIWVAVLGHLYSPNPERGVYKSTDGGQNWKQTLFINENAGAIDLQIDPENPDVLYAATWERERRAWNFVESGEGSGIYMSKNGGESWEIISSEDSGFPTGEGTGRIALAITEEEGTNKIYAFLDNYFRRTKEKKTSEELIKNDFKTMSKDHFLKLDKKKIEKYLRSNGFPEKYNAKKIYEMVNDGKIAVIDLAEYLESANSLLFDTPVKGAEIYVSTDNGKKWEKTHEGYLDNVYNSYGYYFGLLKVAPDDPNKIYIAGVPILRSNDGGKTFTNINKDNVHVDHHALWINPNRPGHIINGNDGGINISYDDGENWIKCNSPAVGQFYYINVDMAEPYNVYGGTQDNGVWAGSHEYGGGVRWHATGSYPYKSLMGGDGMQVQIDSRDNSTVYTGFQFGNYYRVNKKTNKRKFITPKHDLGQERFRWNWQAPIHLSIHNQDILYMGSNMLHRSMNKGDTFEIISDDLTTGGIKGDVAYSTLTSIHESPKRFGLIYTGSDDGLIHVTQNGGYSWEKISDGLPERMWVSRVQASMYDKALVYASLNGYRWDDFNSYLYRSDDYGKNWTRIGLDLPFEPINVIKEDPKNDNIIYVATDHAAYVSLDRGNTFLLIGAGLPASPIHDLVVHPRDGDLLIGTHGRSIYVADIKPLQQLTEEKREEEIIVFSINPKKSSSRWGTIRNVYTDPVESKFDITTYSKSAGKATFQVKTTEGNVLLEKEVDIDFGIDYIEYDYSIDLKHKKKLEDYLNKDLKKDQEAIKIKKADNEKIYLKKGKYTVLVKRNGKTSETELELK